MSGRRDGPTGFYVPKIIGAATGLRDQLPVRGTERTEAMARWKIDRVWKEWRELLRERRTELDFGEPRERRPEEWPLPRPADFAALVRHLSPLAGGYIPADMADELAGLVEGKPLRGGGRGRVRRSAVDYARDELQGEEVAFRFFELQGDPGRFEPGLPYDEAVAQVAREFGIDFPARVAELVSRFTDAGEFRSRLLAQRDESLRKSDTARQEGAGTRPSD